MNNFFKKTALALAIAAASGLALADTAETKGGLKIKTDDGRFEMAIGGRVHLDAYMVSEDDNAIFGSNGVPALSSSSGARGDPTDQAGGLAFRRTYLTLTGKAYGWKYKFEHDFSAEAGSATTTCLNITAVPARPNCTTSLSNTGASGFREMWVSTNVGPGELTLGQFKPYRGMEELTSSNEITMIERPVTSATGIYANRQFLMGVGYKGVLADMLGYQAHAMQLGAANSTNEGTSVGSRLYAAPLNAEGSVVHVGVSYSVDNEPRRLNPIGTVASPEVNTNRPQYGYAGRRGPALRFGDAGSNPAASNDDHQTTMAAELGFNFGPATLQAEYALAELENSNAPTLAQADSDVAAYYVQGSLFLTGETPSYKLDRGAFGKVKPAGEYGAWELTARYEFIENKDESATTDFCSVGAGVSTTGGNTATRETKCEATTLTAGLNWYVNPNVRIMANYYIGEADVGTSKDKPKAATLRTQFSF